MQPKVAISVLGKCITSSELDPKWKVFPSILESKGLLTVPLSDVNATHYFSLEHDSKSLKLIETTVPIARRTLIIVEPRSVHPKQYQRKVRACYHRTLVLSPRHLHGYIGEVWQGGHLPSPDNVITEVRRSQKFDRISGSVGMINENKFSLIPGNQYKKRYLVIKEFIDNGAAFTLAGKNWDKGLLWTIAKQGHALMRAVLSGVIPSLCDLRFQTLRRKQNLHYVGQVNSQLEFLRRLEFAVVIENEATYMTEKLLNAVIAGCVPLFLGPPLSEFGVPDDVAVQINGFKNSFFDAFGNMDPDRVSSIKLQGQKWITDPKTLERWGVLNGFERLSSRIKQLVTL